MAVQARLVDPPDVRWEVSEPLFRVHLWRRGRLPDVPRDVPVLGVTRHEVGWHCSGWELSGGDVEAALRWADEHGAGWDAVDVWVVVPPGRHRQSRGLVRLRDRASIGASTSSATGTSTATATGTSTGPSTGTSTGTRPGPDRDEAPPP